MVKGYFILLLIIGAILTPLEAHAEVCFTDSEAVDIITILDASERDLKVISNCEKLVKDVYEQLDIRDKQLQGLTKDLVEAKHDVIKYKASAKQWRKYTWYTAAGAAVILLIKVAPIL
jgi:hypothetical protein